MSRYLGIDVGGSGAKGAIIDTDTGQLVSDRYKVSTPDPVTPESMGTIIAEIAEHHGWHGTMGIALPSIIRNGVVSSAANIHPDWIGVDGVSLFERHTGQRVTLLNDADAAAIAESRMGAGRNESGLMTLLTLGTGIGSGLVIDGRLIPNTELGHLEFRGGEAEDYAAASVREDLDLSWEEWAGRVNEFLEHIVFLFSPSLVVLGGGVAKADESTQWFPHIHAEATRVVLTEFRNNAGIVGAALAAAP